ncbi:MAG: hypothetical protein AB7N54_02860 [Alphaproteobacteria bacterium]
MNVDPAAYPSLGPDQTAPEKPAKSAAKTEATPKTAAAAPAPEPRAAAPDPRPAAAEAAPPSAPAMAAAAQQQGAGAAQGRTMPPTALIVAIAAAIVAIVALGFAWFTYSEGMTLTAQVQAQAESDRQARHAVAAGLALQQLGARARAGGPFMQELQLTRELAGDDAASREFLDALAPFAEQGLPSLQLLQASFSRAVLQPARRAIPATVFASFTSMIERMLPNGRTEVVVPRAGLEELFEAERAVIAGDLQTAVAAAQPYLDTLPLAGQWVAIAEHRLRAEKALADIDALVWQKLGGAR